MKSCKSLKEVTGKALMESFSWLMENEDGCCSWWYDSTEKYRYCVCMGWHHYDDEMVKDEVGNPVLDKWGVPKYEPVWKVAWKIGRQTHNNIMQCDFDIDFDMPWVTEEMAKDAKKEGLRLCVGEVDDTCETIECFARPNRHGNSPYSAPKGYRSWNALAAYMRKTARRVYKDFKNYDD